MGAVRGGSSSHCANEQAAHQSSVSIEASREGWGLDVVGSAWAVPQQPLKRVQLTHRQRLAAPPFRALPWAAICQGAVAVAWHLTA